MWLLNSIGTSRKLRSPPLPSPPPPLLPPLQQPLPLPPSLSTSLSIRFQPAITIGCDASPGESNPFGESTNSLFVSDSLSFSLPLLIFFYSFYRSLSGFLSLSLYFLLFLPSSFLALVFLVLMTLFLSQESLPRERFATEGYSYRFPGAFRPFTPIFFPTPLPSSRHSRLLNVSFWTNSKSALSKVPLENWLNCNLMATSKYTLLPYKTRLLTYIYFVMSAVSIYWN